LLDPMRARRETFSDDDVIDVLKQGTMSANLVAEETLEMAKDAAGLGFFKRRLEFE
jgi:hypothetical protein